MKLGELFRRQPKALDAPQTEVGVSPVADAMASNDAVKRKQMLLLSGAGAVALVLGSLYIFDDGDSGSDTDLEEKVTEVSTDDMVNKSMSEKEWRAQSEAQLQSMNNQMRSLAARAQQADQLEAQLQRANGQNGAMTEDTQRVLGAYQQENEQLKAALAAARQSPVMGPQPGPNGLYGRSSPPSYAQAGPKPGGPSLTPAGQAAAAAAGLPVARGNEVKLVSFGDAPSGTGMPVPKGNTVYTDSSTYLPPNSIAVAKVIVGVDASEACKARATLCRSCCG